MASAARRATCPPTSTSTSTPSSSARPTTPTRRRVRPRFTEPSPDPSPYNWLAGTVRQLEGKIQVLEKVLPQAASVFTVPPVNFDYYSSAYSPTGPSSAAYMGYADSAAHTDSVATGSGAAFESYGKAVAELNAKLQATEDKLSQRLADLQEKFCGSRNDPGDDYRVTLGNSDSEVDIRDFEDAVVHRCYEMLVQDRDVETPVANRLSDLVESLTQRVVQLEPSPEDGRTTTDYVTWADLERKLEELTSDTDKTVLQTISAVIDQHIDTTIKPLVAQVKTIMDQVQATMDRSTQEQTQEKNPKKKKT